MEEKDYGTCCKDEHKHFKLTVDQSKSDVTQIITFVATLVLYVPVIDFDFQSYAVITEKYPACHAPPGMAKERLHVIYGVFLI